MGVLTGLGWLGRRHLQLLKENAEQKVEIENAKQELSECMEGRKADRRARDLSDGSGSVFYDRLENE